jgi:metal-responsive CopG/Arc/MetJ family transcriptional regulator
MEGEGNEEICASGWSKRIVRHGLTLFYNANMRTAKTVSITLPPELLAKAQAVAERESRTMSELFREALRRYMTSDPEWDGLRRTRAKGASLGIASEADVERMSDEHRSSKRR